EVEPDRLRAFGPERRGGWIMRDGVVRVGFVQMAMSESREDNLRRAGKLVAEGAAQGAQVVVLPELFADRYIGQRMETARYDLAEPVADGEVGRAVAGMAVASSVTVIGGLYE